MDEMRITEGTSGVDWNRLKGSLAADDFDNGRTPDELRRSFEASAFVVFAWSGERVVGKGRLLADGVCNAYLVDVWTATPFRGRGIATKMVERLLACVPGHHVALFTSEDRSLYERLGFRDEDIGMSKVVGSWLNREATAP